METGKRITYFRTQKNYSVNKLANLAGISQSYLRDVELGNKNPTIEVLSYICEALNISLKDFFDDDLPEQFKNDPLIGKIFKLTPEQKKALEQFLDTIIY
ncbi:MAG: helix-turn-helix transcriptional regulator [Lachnospiraceae bacterium]|nr:helix-turn-helix transcriptional regulator [Lachnospiraceae bacterium]